MKARTFVSICLIAGAAAWAQTTPPSQKVAPETKPAATKPAAKPTAAAPVKPAPPAAKPSAPPAAPAAKPAAPPAAKAAAPKPAAATAAKATAAKPAAARPKSAAAKPAVKKPAAAVKKAMVKTPAPVKRPTLTSLTANKRDPFVSPIRTTEGGPSGPTCTTGKKCLAIDTVDLKGIVRYTAGMIAVVESSTRKVTYFLRENDPVFNGYVVKITQDSVVFRENVVDRLGKQSTRDVVKKVVAPAV